MSTDPMRALLGARPTPTVRRWYAAQVTDSHAGGVFVTELDRDAATPTRVRWGGSYRPTGHCPDGPHDHPLTRLPKGTTVLVAETDHGPWIVHHDEESLPA